LPASFVQAASFLENAVSESTIEVTIPNVASGRLLVLGARGIGTTISSVTDDKSNTWSHVFSGSGVSVFYAANVTGGDVAISVNLAGAATQRSVIVHEVSGIRATSPFSAFNATGFGPGNTGLNAATSGVFTTTADGCYIFGFYHDSGDTANTLTAGTDYTARAISNPAAGVIGHASEDRIVEFAGDVQAAVSLSGSATFTGVMVGAAFIPGDPARRRRLLAPVSRRFLRRR
jgi:hypothetical protein